MAKIEVELPYLHLIQRPVAQPPPRPGSTEVSIHTVDEFLVSVPVYNAAKTGDVIDVRGCEGFHQVRLGGVYESGPTYKLYLIEDVVSSPQGAVPPTPYRLLSSRSRAETDPPCVQQGTYTFRK